MSVVIKDGAGTKSRAEVKENRLQTQAFSTPIFADISENKEDCYILATGGYITISTTDTETGIIYIQNTSQKKHLHLQNFRTCGANPQKWRLYKNPTGGTLVTAKTAAIANNVVLSNDNTPEITVYKGADGSTLSGGTLIDQLINHAGHSLEELQGSMILKKNNSIALTCEVTASTDVCVRVLAFYEDN